MTDSKTYLANNLKRGISLDEVQIPDHHRTCNIEIRNHHKFIRLVNPQYYLNSGINVYPPANSISEGSTEACSFSKVTGSIKGSIGVLVYELEFLQKNGIPAGTHRGEGFLTGSQPTFLLAAMPESNRSSKKWFLNLMWSVPMVVDYRYAVGISEGNPSLRDLYETMYYKKSDEFYRSKGTDPIVMEKSINGFQIAVTANFKPAVNAELTIDFK